MVHDDRDREVSSVEISIPELTLVGGAVDTGSDTTSSLEGSAEPTADTDPRADEPAAIVLTPNRARGRGTNYVGYHDIVVPLDLRFIGATVNATATMLNERGEPVGEPVDLVVELPSDENTPTEAEMLRADLEAALAREAALEEAINTAIGAAFALEQELGDSPDAGGDAVQGFLDSFFDVFTDIEYVEPTPEPVTIPDCAGPDAVAGQPCL